MHALGNIAGEIRTENVVLNGNAEENLKRMIYEKASNTSKLTPSVSQLISSSCSYIDVICFCSLIAS